MKKIVLLLLISISLLGCGTGLIKEFVDAPQVKGIELKSFSIKNKQAVFEIALYNPNAFSLPLSGMNGEVILNQLTIGHINADSQQSLAAHATQLVVLPVLFNPDELKVAAKRILNQQKAQYTFNGGIMTSVGQMSFSKKGELSMQELILSLFQ